MGWFLLGCMVGGCFGFMLAGLLAGATDGEDGE